MLEEENGFIKNERQPVKFSWQRGERFKSFIEAGFAKSLEDAFLGVISDSKNRTNDASKIFHNLKTYKEKMLTEFPEDSENINTAESEETRSVFGASEEGNKVIQYLVTEKEWFSFHLWYRQTT